VRPQDGPLGCGAARPAEPPQLPAELLSAQLGDRNARRCEYRILEAPLPRLKHLAEFDLAEAVLPALAADEPAVLLGESSTNC